MTIISCPSADAHVVAARPRRLGNVFAIEYFMDELAEGRRRRSGDLPAVAAFRSRSRRVSRPRRAISGWFERDNFPEGRARGFGLPGTRTIASFAAVVVEIEVEEDIKLKHVWCAADAGLRHRARWRQKPARRRHQSRGASLRCASRSSSKTAASRPGPGRTIRSSAFSDIPEIGNRLIDNPNEPTLGLGEASVGPTGAAIGNALARRARQTGPRFAADAERIMATLLAE